MQRPRRTGRQPSAPPARQRRHRGCRAEASTTVALVARGLERIHRSPTVLGDEVYDRIVTALVEGALGPGDRLIQDRLAEELDVSRTPVRDALKRLHVEGVLEPAGRRGYVVRRLGDNDVEAIYDTRRVIEGHAAALVAELGAPAIASIRAAFEAAIAEPTTSAGQVFTASRMIHRAIVPAARNHYLLDFFDAIWGRAAIGLAYQQGWVLESYEELVEHHRSLVDALATATPDEAREIMIKHIEDGRARAAARSASPAASKRAGLGSPAGEPERSGSLAPRSA
jgi:DNA-binding GntR family transcriptional regulator